MLRQLTSADIEMFNDIRTEAIRTNPESFGSPEEEHGGDAQRQAYLCWLSGDVWGAFEDQNLIGVAGFYITQDKRVTHRGNLFTVYVRPASRGQGMGDLLIKKILSVAEKRVDQMKLMVVTTAIPAIKTYLSNGFEFYGRDRGAFRVNDASYDEYLMIKKFR
jgi:ribosomal protein S18 acetylase RimI-like enzyme